MENNTVTFQTVKLAKAQLRVNDSLTLAAEFSARVYDGKAGQYATVSADVNFGDGKVYTYLYKDASGRAARITDLAALKSRKQEIVAAAGSAIVAQIKRDPRYSEEQKLDRNGVPYTENVLERFYDNPNAGANQVSRIDVVLRHYPNTINPFVKVTYRPDSAFVEPAVRTQLLPSRPRASYVSNQVEFLSALRREIETLFVVS